MINRMLATVIGGSFCLAGFTLPALAVDDHWDQVSCYFYVWGQCYGNGEENCSSDDYNWGLDQCDGYYEQSSGRRKPPPSGLTLKTTNPRVKTTISSSFKKQR